MASTSKTYDPAKKIVGLGLATLLRPYDTVALLGCISELTCNSFLMFRFFLAYCISVMSITLFTKHVGGSQETFNDSKTDLKAEATFQKAVVTTGTWILYTYANYNDAQAGGSPSNHQVLKEGDQADITSVNGSMYLVENATEGFILFDHYYYGGARQVRVARVKPALNRKTSPREVLPVLVFVLVLLLQYVEWWIVESSFFQWFCKDATNLIFVIF